MENLLNFVISQQTFSTLFKLTFHKNENVSYHIYQTTDLSLQLRNSCKLSLVTAVVIRHHQTKPLLQKQPKSVIKLIHSHKELCIDYTNRQIIHRECHEEFSCILFLSVLLTVSLSLVKLPSKYIPSRVTTIPLPCLTSSCHIPIYFSPRQP